MKKLLVATGNAHKLSEIQKLLSISNLEIESMRAYPDAPEPIEDGSTFEENALIKARSLAEYAKAWALADDSGIEVDGLDKAPGIYSARYAGEHGDDEANNQKLIRNVAELEDRSARFVCAIALVSPDGQERVCRATVEGFVISEMRGAAGFGYDGMFIPSGYEKTFGELGPELKDSFSHRARALAQLKPVIEALVN